MKINTDAELDKAIAEVDRLIDAGTDENDPRLNELSDAIEEYESRTDILNREPDGSE
jgi:antitoxin component HigA of HigAB toxin-antitoxin module